MDRAFAWKLITMEDKKKLDKILRELMEDDIGKKLKKKVMDWK